MRKKFRDAIIKTIIFIVAMNIIAGFLNLEKEVGILLVGMGMGIMYIKYFLNDLK